MSSHKEEREDSQKSSIQSIDVQISLSSKLNMSIEELKVDLINSGAQIARDASHLYIDPVFGQDPPAGIDQPQIYWCRY